MFKSTIGLIVIDVDALTSVRAFVTSLTLIKNLKCLIIFLVINLKVNLEIKGVFERKIKKKEFNLFKKGILVHLILGREFGKTSCAIASGSSKRVRRQAARFDTRSGTQRAF